MERLNPEKKESVFIRIFAKDKSDNWEKVILVFNERKIIPAPSGEIVKPCGYSLPGGGIRDYQRSLMKFTIPDDCETPEEGGLRELFEETGLTLEVNYPTLRNDLLSLVPAFKKSKSSFIELTAQSYIEVIHDYARRTGELGYLKSVPLAKENQAKKSPAYLFEVDVAHLVGFEEMTTLYDLATNTREVRWFPREEIEGYIRTFEDWWTSTPEEVKCKGERPMPYRIYTSTLERLGFDMSFLKTGY